MDNTRTLTMNFIKKYRLKKKLKKAIDLISTAKAEIDGETDGTHYMCGALKRCNIDKNTLPGFNFKSFEEFIEIYYSELIPYLCKDAAIIYQYTFSWMVEDKDENYPDEEITKAKRHFLHYIMTTL